MIRATVLIHILKEIVWKVYCSWLLEGGNIDVSGVHSKVGKSLSCIFQNIPNLIFLILSGLNPLNM